jgi:pyruvate/2-oxoglutarate dehydrogenase complex dihydrolipoamide acyltransferase (E2) component
MDELVITMPQLGESVSEGIVERWLVQPGEAVAELDALVAVSTDKVEAEVPAPASGVLREILVPEGAAVPVGAPIAVLALSGDVAEQAAAASMTGSTDHNEGTSLRGAADDEVGAPRDSPAPTRPVPAAPPAPVATAPGDADEVRPLGHLRRVVAERMALSKSTIPHALQVQEVDMARVMASIAHHADGWARREGGRLTPLPYVIAAAAAALRQTPQLNATFAGDHIVIHQRIHIGVAVALADGVVVPVVRDADRLSTAEIARTVSVLVDAARSQRLDADQMGGGTFTVNNSGALGTLFSYSVIQPGEAGILTMGAVTERPCVREGSVVARPLMYLSLSLDHRAVDGLGAAIFLGECRRRLEAVIPDMGLDR